jgi:Recombinase
MKLFQRQHAIGPLLLKLHSEGTSYAAMASELHDRGIVPPRGGRWREASLWRYLKRAMNVSSLRRPREAGA